MPLYYMLNKPYGCVTACRDELYPTVMDRLPPELASRLHPVGRLDYDTRGMLLLTDDGELDPALLLPENHVDKEYFFYAIGELTDEKIARIEGGCMLGGGRTVSPARIMPVRTYSVREIEPYLPPEEHDRYMKNPDGSAFSARITLREGKKHQVKRMLRAVNCRICALFRTSFAGIPLDPSLAPGEYRALTEAEIAVLNEKKEAYRREKSGSTLIGPQREM